MPGLIGIVGKGTPDVRRTELEMMTRCMYTTGSMKSGSYTDEAMNVCVGWTCHKGSYSDCMPIRSASDDLVMFFSGEHFPSEALNEGCHSTMSNRLFRRADTLLPIYREKGESFYPALNGFFHGLIIDPQKKEVILFNDRFGMQRVYYYEEPDAFYFASEAKSILAIRSKLRAFDPESLGEWMSCGAVLENRSLFKGIRILPGASCWKWRFAPIPEKKVYFKPEYWERLPILSSSKFYERVRGTFKARLPHYLQSEGTVGVSATGGLDTRMILANLGPHKKSVHCYSFNGPYRENLDVSIGRRVAYSLGLPHTTINIERAFFDSFEKLAEEVVLSTDGNLDMSGAPNLYVNSVSREISDVRLTGNYGSEIFRRYQAFRPTNAICRVLRPDWINLVKKAANTWNGCRKCHRLTYIGFKQVPWFSYNRLQAEQSIMNMRSPFMDNFLLEVVYQSPDECTKSNLVSLRLIFDGNRELANILTDRGVSHPKRASWILTRPFYELVFKMEHYASHGMPSSFASIDKHLGPLSLERIFIGRNKYYHLRQWFRDELSEYVKSILLDKESLSRAYIAPVELKKAVAAHIAGKENNTSIISKLISLELINRLLFSNHHRG